MDKAKWIFNSIIWFFVILSYCIIAIFFNLFELIENKIICFNEWSFKKAIDLSEWIIENIDKPSWVDKIMNKILDW